MEMVLQSACPQFLFEVHLKRAILEQQLPPNLFKGNTGYYDLRQRYTTIDELLSLLFDDFFFAVDIQRREPQLLWRYL